MGSGASAPAALVADDAQMQAIAEKTGLPVEDIKVMGEQFKALDTNNSGSVSLSELHRDHASRTFLWQFDREAFKSACVELLDAETDDDGVLTFDEFVTNRALQKKADAEGLPPLVVMQAHSIYKVMDKNDDRKVSVGEFNAHVTKFPGQWKSIIEALPVDTSGDGFVTFDELLALVQGMAKVLQAKAAPQAKASAAESPVPAAAESPAPAAEAATEGAVPAP